MTDTIDPGFLRNSELFESQPEEVILAVLAQGQLLEFGPGEVVFRQGERGDRLFVVKSGVLEVLSTPTDATEDIPLFWERRPDQHGRVIVALLSGSVQVWNHADLLRTIERQRSGRAD